MAFAVNHMNLHSELVVKMSGEMFGAIDRAVLPSRTTEGYLQVRETAFKETRDMMVHQFLHRREEDRYFSVLLKEVNDWLVQAGERFILIVLAGVMCRAAVEDIASTVSAGIFRNTAFIRKGVNRY